MDTIVGQSIVQIRPMTAREIAAEGWDLRHGETAVAIVLSNGLLIYPSQDHEGNGAGVLFGTDPKTKESFAIGG